MSSSVYFESAETRRVSWMFGPKNEITQQDYDICKEVLTLAKQTFPGMDKLYDGSNVSELDLLAKNISQLKLTDIRPCVKSVVDKFLESITNSESYIKGGLGRYWLPGESLRATMEFFEQLKDPETIQSELKAKKEEDQKKAESDTKAKAAAKQNAENIYKADAYHEDLTPVQAKEALKGRTYGHYLLTKDIKPENIKLWGDLQFMLSFVKKNGEVCQINFHASQDGCSYSHIDGEFIGLHTRRSRKNKFLELPKDSKIDSDFEKVAVPVTKEMIKQKPPGVSEGDVKASVDSSIQAKIAENIRLLNCQDGLTDDEINFFAENNPTNYIMCTTNQNGRNHYYVVHYRRTDKIIEKIEITPEENGYRIEYDNLFFQDKEKLLWDLGLLDRKTQLEFTKVGEKIVPKKTNASDAGDKKG